MSPVSVDVLSMLRTPALASVSPPAPIGGGGERTERDVPVAPEMLLARLLRPLMLETGSVKGIVPPFSACGLASVGGRKDDGRPQMAWVRRQDGSSTRQLSNKISYWPSAEDEVMCMEEAVQTEEVKDPAKSVTCKQCSCRCHHRRRHVDVAGCLVESRQSGAESGQAYSRYRTVPRKCCLPLVST